MCFSHVILSRKYWLISSLRSRISYSLRPSAVNVPRTILNFGDPAVQLTDNFFAPALAVTKTGDSSSGPWATLRRSVRRQIHLYCLRLAKAVQRALRLLLTGRHARNKGGGGGESHVMKLRQLVKGFSCVYFLPYQPFLQKVSTLLVWENEANQSQCPRSKCQVCDRA